MNGVSEIFKREPNEEEMELRKRLLYLRRMSMAYAHWPIREVQQFCIDWQEVTGHLLEKGNRPGFEEKFADADTKRQQLKEIVNRGIARK